MSLHYRHEGHFPAVITAMGEQMANNMDCGHPAWPLGTSTLLGCSVAKSAWGKLFLRILHAEVVSVHPLKAPMAFTHLLPGASRRRVAAPPSLPRHHTLLLMCQQTAIPACQGSMDPPKGGSDSSRRARTVNVSLSKKMRPMWDWPEM